jgi:hypothetical protein
MINRFLLAFQHPLIRQSQSCVDSQCHSTTGITSATAIHPYHICNSKTDIASATATQASHLQQHDRHHICNSNTAVSHLHNSNKIILHLSQHDRHHICNINTGITSAIA